MQIRMLLLPFLLFPLMIQGQYFYYEIGDTLTVTAKSGLSLRDSSSVHSTKVGVIPFGQKVIAASTPIGRDVFSHRSGHWIKVNYGNQEGYVFSGFLTKLKIPEFEIEELSCYNLEWFENLIRANVDTLLCEGNRLYKGFDPDKGGGSSDWEMYSNETIINHTTSYESYDLVIESNQITMNDILNLLEFYTEQLKKKCSDAYYLREGDIPLRIDVKKDNNKGIKSIECYQLYFSAEKTIGKIIIILNIDR